MSSLHKTNEIYLEASASVDHAPSVTSCVEKNECDNKESKEKRVSDASECSVVIADLESVTVPETTKLCLDKIERDCRICQSSLDVVNQDSGSGAYFELGCACKDDLAAAHKQCAEAWFKIKGNKTCEICGSVAQNVTGVPDRASTEQWDTTTDADTVARASIPLSDARNFWKGHKFLNLLLACMVFAFVISWLFHFNVPS